MTNEGPREIYVDYRRGALVEVPGPLSNVELAEHLHETDTSLQTGWRQEISLEANRWIGRAAATLDRGFLLLFDYAYESHAYDSGRHRNGTLTAYRDHTADAVHWLSCPGASDLTAHVDLTSIRRTAESVGFRTLGCVDQTYFLMALGLADRVTAAWDVRSVGRRLAAKTLMLPGGLGSTMKTMLFAKDVGQPSLRGLARGRLT